VQHRIVRPDGTVVACNGAFVRSFGFASTEEALAANDERLGASLTRAPLVARPDGSLKPRRD